MPHYRDAAKIGIDLHNKHNRGGTHVGLTIAQRLVEGDEFSEEEILHMYSYFARHEVDKKAKGFDNLNNPSKGYIAWQLWGGEPGKRWVKEIRNSLKR